MSKKVKITIPAEVQVVTLPEGQQQLSDFSRHSLADSNKLLEGAVFPVTLTPSSTAQSYTHPQWCKWINTHGDFLARLVENHGCILFRGFPNKTAQHFLDFIKSFKGFEYNLETFIGGGGPRNQVLGPVHTSTESPKEFKIPLHHELAYLNRFPTKLFFFCEIAPAANGETPICMSNRLVEKIRSRVPKFVENVKTKKVRYIRVLADKANNTDKYQRPWQEIFTTEDRAEAERLAKETGHDLIEWLPNNDMRLRSIPMDGIVTEKRTGKEIWFNSIVLLHPAAHATKKVDSLWQVVYGDLTPMADEDIRAAKDAMLESEIAYKWQAGDVLLVDNFLSLHSRNPFTPPRRILAAMVSKEN